MKALYDSLIRTFVPWLAGVIVTWLVSLGVPLDPEVAPKLLALLMLIASGLYYIVARLLEMYVSPKFGWLLGLAKQPDYFKRVKVTENGETFQIREPETRSTLDLTANGAIRTEVGSVVVDDHDDR